MEDGILVNKAIRAKLLKEFNVSEVTIRKALKGNVTTFLHAKIRERAIELGGLKKW